MISDQGSQFTGLLAANGIQISMAGKGSWRDNVFVERLWRSIKYEPVVTDDNLRRAKLLVEQGLTVREAAARVKVSKTALYDALAAGAAAR